MECGAQVQGLGPDEGCSNTTVLPALSASLLKSQELSTSVTQPLLPPQYLPSTSPLPNPCRETYQYCCTSVCTPSALPRNDVLTCSYPGLIF